MGYRFASGKRALAICDVCGFRCDYVELRQVYEKGRPTGVRACPECWDPDHPQNFLGEQEIRDPQALRNARPDDAEYDAVRAQIVRLNGVFSYPRVGRSAVIINIAAEPTGIVIPLALGSVDVFRFNIIELVGVESVGVVADAIVKNDVPAPVTGVFSIGQLGQLGFTGSADVLVTGQEIIPELGDVVVTGGGGVILTGVSTTPELGIVSFANETTWGEDTWSSGTWGGA